MSRLLEIEPDVLDKMLFLKAALLLVHVRIPRRTA
jgi:hypothetical protein